MADNGTGWNSPKIAPVGTALEKQLELIVPQILAIMETCKKMPAGIRRQSVDKIVKLALESDLASRRTILARHCGIHPNSHGPFYAQHLVLKLSQQGYSETKLEPIMGFEKALSGRLHDVPAYYDRNFAEGYLETLDFRDIEYLPATCSHTAAAINIIEGGGPGLHEELCNAEGNVDIAKVLALCPSWEQAIKVGMPCIVFKHELETACPELPAFLSKAFLVEPSLPIKAMPVQKLEQVAKKRPAAATGRMQQTANNKKKR